jgi:hypothetical protein
MTSFTMFRCISDSPSGSAGSSRSFFCENLLVAPLLRSFELRAPFHCQRQCRGLIGRHLGQTSVIQYKFYFADCFQPTRESLGFTSCIRRCCDSGNRQQLLCGCVLCFLVITKFASIWSLTLHIGLFLHHVEGGARDARLCQQRFWIRKKASRWCRWTLDVIFPFTEYIF